MIATVQLILGQGGQETSTAMWIALLTLIATNLLQLAKQWLDGRQRIEEAERVAKATREVKITMEASTQAAAKRMDEMATSIEVVHKATNSIKDELVEAVRKEATLQGAKDEREKGGKP